jgi:Glycosyltransferase sugar-binding region containing DXD motif
MPEVPKIFHFMTSAKSATAETAATIKSFVAKNPGWKAWVWCDQASMGANHAVFSAKDPNVEVKPIDTNVAGLAPAPVTAPSYGATSDVLRYQILLQNGGCYVDSDAEPGDPMPNLTVSADSALFAPAKPGRPRDTAIACVIGSQRIRQLGQEAAVKCAAVASAPASPRPAVVSSADGGDLGKYVRSGAAA